MTRRLLRRLAGCARRFAAHAGPHGFRHLGVLVEHRGLLVDQAGVSRAIDDALRLVASVAPRGTSVAPTVRRIRVDIRDANDPLPAMEALWSGGLLDRGVVRIRVHDHWLESLTTGIVGLICEDQGFDNPLRQGANERTI